MGYLSLACLLVGLLLAVRLMLFGAERRRAEQHDLPLRRWEPALVTFLVVFGLAGYLLTRRSSMGGVKSALLASVIGVAFALAMTRLAVATARVQPEHDPDDPRFRLQGLVGTALSDIGAAAGGLIRFNDAGTSCTLPARAIDAAPIIAGDEVCIERVDDGVAFVERWSVVEQRL
ncbi:MAG: hypothetical protein H0W68_02030 [Gemmatimonadaceae bacterium]|nr:hypothetical protein [Gemmatimonadaceae bacterium]